MYPIWLCLGDCMIVRGTTGRRAPAVISWVFPLYVGFPALHFYACVRSLPVFSLSQVGGEPSSQTSLFYTIQVSISCATRDFHYEASVAIESYQSHG